MLHNFYNDIFDKIEFFGNCSFDGCKPSTVFLIICRCINGLFRYMFVNYVSIKKKKKEKKKPSGLGTAHVLHNSVPFDGAG